jgi:thiol-disulfide isomerase/thioredoxin
MNRQNTIFVALLVILAVAIVAAGYATGRGPLGVISIGISRLTSGGQTMIPSRTLVTENKAPTAPEIAGSLWINSEPLTLKSLRGRVVLIEFWTFACYNCRNTLPTIKAWDTRYRDKGLTIIGVHTPEFDSERNIDSLRREVAELDIPYPVVSDTDYSTWKAYKVEAWPTLFVLDKQGHVRWGHVGEGAYEETEQVIKKLLGEEEPKRETGESKRLVREVVQEAPSFNKTAFRGPSSRESLELRTSSRFARDGGRQTSGHTAHSVSVPPLIF